MICSNLDELDSYMYQTVGYHAIELYAEAMDLPLYRHTIQGTALGTERDYQPLENDEVEDLYHLLQRIKVHVNVWILEYLIQNDGITHKCLSANCYPSGFLLLSFISLFLSLVVFLTLSCVNPTVFHFICLYLEGESPCMCTCLAHIALRKAYIDKFSH